MSGTIEYTYLETLLFMLGIGKLGKLGNWVGRLKVGKGGIFMGTKKFKYSQIYCLLDWFIMGGFMGGICIGKFMGGTFCGWKTGILVGGVGILIGGVIRLGVIL